MGLFGRLVVTVTLAVLLIGLGCTVNVPGVPNGNGNNNGNDNSHPSTLPPGAKCYRVDADFVVYYWDGDKETRMGKLPTYPAGYQFPNGTQNLSEAELRLAYLGIDCFGSNPNWSSCETYAAVAGTMSLPKCGG